MTAARTIRSAPPAYASPYPAAAVGATRKFVQGIGAALLVFTGAGAMTRGGAVEQTNAGSASPVSVADVSTIEGLLQTVSSGQFAGPLQIALAVLIFIAAGRCVARFLGLAVAAVAIVLYLQGVTVEDSLMFIERFAGRLDAAAQAFLTADVG